MVKPQFHSNAKEMLGEEFSQLLYEIAPFVEPRVTAYYSKKHFIISVDIAGAHTEDLTLTLNKNAIVIKGTIRNNHAEDCIKLITSERFFGSFKREIEVPELCILDQLHAEYNRGILLITVPFYNKDQSNKIEINT